MTERRQKLRARFAMWVVDTVCSILDPWIKLYDHAPPDDDWEDPYTEAVNAAYDEGAATGWREGYNDAQAEFDEGWQS